MGSVQFQIDPCSILYFVSRSIVPFQCLVNVNYSVLICCTCHFQSSSLFVYFGFLCLQVSTVYSFCSDTRGREVTYLASLIQLYCEEGATLQTNITGMCGQCLQCMNHTGLAQLLGSVLSWSTQLRLQVALQGNCPKQALGFMHFPGLRCSDPGSRVLHKSTDSVGPAFCALPSSELLRRPCAWQMHCPRWPVHLNHLPSPSHLVSWVHPSAFSGVLCVFSGELISGCDPPGRFQLSRIPGRLG